MAVRHSIELLMSLAFVLYVGAFAVARRHWAAHIWLALSGFVADMAATGLMIYLHSQSGTEFLDLPGRVQAHMALAILAVGIFFVQAGLGLLGRDGPLLSIMYYRRLHVRCAKFVFLPVWVLAYASGLAMFLK